MSLSDPELAHFFHQRARRAMQAGLRALGRAPAELLGKDVQAETVHEALSVAVMRFVVISLGRARGLFAQERDFATGRLFAPLDARLETKVVIRDGLPCWDFAAAFVGAEQAFHAELEDGLKSDGVDLATCPAELVGNLYELLLGEGLRHDEQGGGFELKSGKRRKQTGTFFTPRALTEVVVERALEPLHRRIRSSSHRAHDFVIDYRVCDPAVGGGAFLLQVMRALSLRPGERADSARRRALVTRVVHGVDVNPIAVAVAEAALCLYVAEPAFSLHDAGKNLRVGDALLGPPHASTAIPSSARTAEPKDSQRLDFLAEFPEVFEAGGFDLVIGNPPWVAYAGRAAQPLSAERKAYLSDHYSSLRGYPTLHGLFVERALRLAPQGTVALVVPSPIADLHGYRAVRRVVRATHTPCEPMLEFGQDAFASVTQPCFALIAEASTGSASAQGSDEQPFRLAERQRAAGSAAEVLAPAALLELAKAPGFPRELFGEMGFQTTSTVSKHLLRRSPDPDPIHHYPLLEGRDVREFREGEPRLFLSPDVEALAKARCRLRSRDDYQRVRFVIRQTARYPIAALHRGLPFRNSLLAGFAVDGLPADLVVGLLNSSLYRALHLALRRDARQATFPQVKIGHLRALPEPPSDPGRRAEIAEISATSTRSGFDRALADRLDAAVFALFELESSAVHEILQFLAARGARRD
jgi:methylase of polypeptide subunit release factors